MDLTQAIILTIATAATPLLIAAIGEVVVERSGVLNLGVEGMMLMGAVSGFAIAQMTGSAWLGLLAAILVGMMFAAVFGFLTLTLVTNQVATGLALTILGVGGSALLGESFVGLPGVRLNAIHIPYLTDIPLVGRFLFGQDPIFYMSILLVAGVAWFLFRTRAGLTLRAIGDSHGSAHALGVHVVRTRYLAVLFGGACAGLAGAQLSLVYVPQWVENMTAGRGWIALALVVFASWRPWRSADRRISVWRRYHWPASRAGAWLRVAIAIPVCIALYCDNRGAGHHLAQQAPDDDEYTGITRQAVRAGSMRRVRGKRGPAPNGLCFAQQISGGGARRFAQDNAVLTKE